MIGSSESPGERRHDAEAWSHLVEDEPEMILCPFCGGEGFHTEFAGHGYARILHECTECGTTGKVPA